MSIPGDKHRGSLETPIAKQYVQFKAKNGAQDFGFTWNVYCSHVSLVRFVLQPEGSIVAIFEPDILNGVSAKRGPSRAIPAERRLMVAVLADAFGCFQKNLLARSAKKRRLFLEAEQWIRSEDMQWPFSFRNICDVLGFDPDALRAQADAWERHLARTTHA